MRLIVNTYLAFLGGLPLRLAGAGAASFSSSFLRAGGDDGLAALVVGLLLADCFDWGVVLVVIRWGCNIGRLSYVFVVGDVDDTSLPASLEPGDEPFTFSVDAGAAVADAVVKMAGGLRPGITGFLVCNGTFYVLDGHDIKLVLFVYFIVISFPNRFIGSAESSRTEKAGIQQFFNYCTE